MNESEVRDVFGDPDEIERGGGSGDEDVFVNWYYYAYAAQPYLEWIIIPGPKGYGGTLEQVQTSRGVRYQKYRIVFTNGVVFSASELAPPEF